MRLRRRVHQLLRHIYLFHEEETLHEVEVLAGWGHLLSDGQARMEALCALVQTRYEGVGYVPQRGVLILQPRGVEAEYSLELLLYLGRDGEESDLEGLLLVECGLEVGDEDADEGPQLAAHLADIIVHGADPFREVLVDPRKEVTAQREKTISSRNSCG